MKLSAFAKRQGISYSTALRWFHDGVIKGYQAPSGTIIVNKDEPVLCVQKVAIYARVFSAEHRASLERQAGYKTWQALSTACAPGSMGNGEPNTRPIALCRNCKRRMSRNAIS